MYLFNQLNKVIQNLLHFNQIIVIKRDNKLVITTELKTFNFDLPKDTGTNLKHEIYSTIEPDEYTVKNKIRKYCPNIIMGNNIHEHGKQTRETLKRVNHANSFVTCNKD